MKVLVTGAAGMLGGAVCPTFSQHGHVVVRTDINLLDAGIGLLDVRKRDHIRRWMDEVRPDAVLHLAAETDVDRSEREPAHAIETNATGTRLMAEACAESSTLMVYISTAGVFDGEKEGPYVETDAAMPIMVYGRSKLAGEEFVKATVNHYYILRAGWMIGGESRDKKFVSKILEQVAAGTKTIHAVVDKFGTPTYTTDFAKNMLALLATGKHDLYHMACSGTGTRLDVARHILETIGRTDIALVPVNSEFFRASYPAPRPRSEMMRNANLQAIGLDLMRDWRVALTDYLKHAHAVGTMQIT
jgi:dTDP-4-dehydrorhamnose reductase